MRANVKVAVYRKSAPRFEEHEIIASSDITLTQLAGVCVNANYADDPSVTRVELVSIDFLGEGAPAAERSS